MGTYCSGHPMTLSTGTRLGPYEILSPIGAGGMGEVYKARDERLKRDVAVKVLPASYSQDADRLRRFEHEAQAAGGLNHPNIMAVYDLGSHEGAPYIVTELLEGETLRARLAGGAIPVRKAIDYAIQTARGLAAAHEKGIVHRDLKPENLFVTNDGRVKILDFGLAKLTQPEGPAAGQTNLPTAPANTEPGGVVMGTLGYMSPEQVKGKPTDQRSDLFSFGAILYEMLSGSRAFHRDSAAETMSAILREEPPDLSSSNKNVQPGLERIVRHCLEKNPEERFYSARDVAFDLEALSGLSGAATAATAAPPSGRRRLLPAAAAAAILAALVCLPLGFLAGKGRGAATPPRFRQLTFRRGTVWTARFGSDGKTVLYSASWDANPTEVFVGSPDSPESRPLGFAGADVLAVAPSGDVAISLKSFVSGEFMRTGTLARASATGGGAPREILEGVEAADWAPNGQDLAVVRGAGGGTRLEYPIGKTVYETHGWIGNPRVGPGGRVAFMEHPGVGDDGGFPAVIGADGKMTALTKAFGSCQGLAWSPDGREIWFTAAEVGNRSLYAVSLSGKLRTLTMVTGSLTLQDVSKDGRALLIDETRRLGCSALAPGAKKERDLSWLDWSRPVAFSRDGKTILFYESGEGGGPGYSTYVRATDGSPAVRLGEGQALGITPDGAWAASVLHKLTDPRVLLYPTGAGQAKPLTPSGLRFRQGFRFMPDGRHVLSGGAEEGKGDRVYLLDVEGGKPRPVTPENYRAVGPITTDGRRFVTRTPEGATVIYPVEGGEPVAAKGFDAGDVAVGWTADDRVLYVVQTRGLGSRIDRLDPLTGRRELWKEIVPADPTGIVRISSVLVSPDGSFYGYAYSRVLSNLFLVEGLK
jgi:Tol biopolymer transport system component